MRIRRHRHWWRAAVGLLIAYAFCLQALLGSVLAAQAATGPSFVDGAVICMAHVDGGTEVDEQNPAKVIHCAVCVLAPLAHALAPDRVIAPLRLATRSAPFPFVSAEAWIAFHKAKSNLSQGPPPTA